jgi:hypothetical protein
MSSSLDDVWRTVVSEYGPASSVPAIALERKHKFVRVWFGDGWEDVAEELARTFGSAVRASVGFRGAGHSRPADVPPPACEISHRQLSLTCEASAPFVRRGASVRTRVILKNRGSSRLDAMASADVGFLCDLNSRLVVADYRGARTGMALPLELDPGQQTSLNFVVGTSGTLGSGAPWVQPGTYEIVCPVALIRELPTKRARSRRWLLARGANVEVA